MPTWEGQSSAYDCPTVEVRNFDAVDETMVADGDNLTKVSQSYTHPLGEITWRNMLCHIP